MDKEEVFCRIAAAVMLTGRFVTDRADKLTRELAAELTTPVDADDLNDDLDDNEPNFRTVLVIEVLTALSPYEDGLEGLSGAIARQEVAAGIVTESVDTIGEPAAYSATWRASSAARSGEPFQRYGPGGDGGTSGSAISVDVAHVLLDALKAQRAEIHMGAEPWTDYDGSDGNDPKAHRLGYAAQMRRATAALEAIVGGPSGG